MLNFPDSPINGQVFTSGALAWMFDGTKWQSGAGASVGVTTWNGRTGAVTLTTADVTGAGGAAASSIPAASSLTPVMDGVAAVGTGTTWARADHVHPTDTSLLPLAGGTMVGLLNMGGQKITNMGAPTASAQAATKGYVDTAVAPLSNNLTFRNRIINGSFAIDQRNEGATVSANTAYGPDKWKFFAATAGKLQVTRVTGATNGPFPVAVHSNTLAALTSLSAYTPLASDTYGLQQLIEADVAGDFQFGGSSALPVVLSFWAALVTAGSTGAYSISLRNAGATRSYVATFNIPSLATWTYYQIAIPGDTAGTWVTNGNGSSISVWFDAGSGSTFQTSTLNAWQTGNFVASSSANKLVSTNTAQLQIANVQLEVGGAATPFELLPPEVALARCQRYYEKSYSLGTVPGATSANGYVQSYLAGAGIASVQYQTTVPVQFKMAKRSAPTMVSYSPATLNASGKARDSSNNQDVNGSCLGVGTTAFGANATMYAAVAAVALQWHWTADADF